MPFHYSAELSCGPPMVETQHAAEPLLAANRPISSARVRRAWSDELILQALMIPFEVVVFDILVNHVAKVPLADDDHPIETLRLD